MTEEEIKQIFKDEMSRALSTYFNPHGENRRFYDTENFSRICDDIRSIKTSIKDLATVKETDDHEDRIRKLEFRQAYWAGGAGVLSALGMWGLQHFLK